jgi:hypothetical protein
VTKETADLIKPWIDIGKGFFEIWAYIAAVVFFGYKVLAGYFLIDLGISVDCERKRKPGSENKDYLGISVALKKGERAGLVLHDAQVRVTSCTSPQVLGPYPLTTIWRASRTDRVPDLEVTTKLCPQKGPPPEILRARIDWTCIPGDAPCLNLPPGDESKLAAFVEVDRDIPYIVEVVVLGRVMFLWFAGERFGQWRASKVSLPIVPELKQANP